MSTPTTHNGIVVGVDGSAPSKVAVDWAAREASMRDLPLTIIYVAPSPLVSPDVPEPADLDERVKEHGREVLRDARTTAEEATKGSDPIRIDTEVVEAAILPTLINWSKEADMVVVGCRGLGAIGRRLLGSVSSGLVHHAHCPVAVIHDEDPMMSEPAKAPVAVGIDGSPASERATAIAFEEASRRGRGSCRGARLERPRLPSSGPARVRQSWRRKPRRRSPSGWPGGRNAIPTSPCGVSSHSTSPPISCWSSRSLRN